MAGSYWTTFTPIRGRTLQYAIGNLPGKKTVTYRLQRYADGIRVYRGSKKIGTEQGWQSAQDLVREDYGLMLKGSRSNPKKRSCKKNPYGGSPGSYGYATNPPVKVRTAMNRNGNKVVKIRTDKGGFSIQTNGNLPWTHSNIAVRDNVSTRKIQKVLGEAYHYVRQFGTPRQKELLKDALSKAGMSGLMNNPKPKAPVKSMGGRARQALQAAGIAGTKVVSTKKRSQTRRKIWSIKGTVLTIHIPNINTRQKIRSTLRKRGLSMKWHADSTTNSKATHYKIGRLDRS